MAGWSFLNPPKPGLAMLTKSGKPSAKRFPYARALLLCNADPEGPAWAVAQVAEAMGVTSRTIEHLKQRFGEEALEAALQRRPAQKPPREMAFDGGFEARLIALVRSEAPEERRRRTIWLLGEKAVELSWAPTVSHVTVQRILKNKLKPHLRKYWRIPPQESSAFLARMKDFIALYERFYNLLLPVVCMDETCKQLIGEVHEAIPAAPADRRDATTSMSATMGLKSFWKSNR